MGFDPYVLLFFWSILQQHMAFIFLSSSSNTKSDCQNSSLYLKKKTQMKTLQTIKKTQVELKIKNQEPNWKNTKPNKKTCPTNLNCTSHRAPPRNTLALGATLTVAEALFQKALCILQTRLAASKHTWLGKNLSCLFFCSQAKLLEEHRCRARRTLCLDNVNVVPLSTDKGGLA